MNFLLPEGASAETRAQLRQACLAGGYDRSPMPTEVVVDDGRMTLRRDIDESGQLLVPYSVDAAGLLMASSATLIETPESYDLVAELARGKLNQVRNHLADWRAVGLQTSKAFQDRLHSATHSLGRSVTANGQADPADAAAALSQAFGVGDDLIELCVDQLFEARRQRQMAIDSFLACRVAAPPPVTAEPGLSGTCNRINVPLTWRHVEPTESQYNWSPADSVLAWARSNNLTPTGGPLIDFSAAALPEWLLAWEGDTSSLASFMCDYVETTLSRYKDRIRRWTLCTGGNAAGILGLEEDDLLRLTSHLIEAAHNVDPKLELLVGIAQPWGDYMISEDFTYSPFAYADTLLRVGLGLTGFEVEWYMGTTPRGSYCRDLLEASRSLDLLALLGVPLQVSMAYPSSTGLDPNADPHQTLSGGRWRTGFTPEVQAEWAGRFAAMALSKPFVVGVTWGHLSDGEPHLVPHGGLVDAAGQVKPAMEALKRVRDRYLS